MRPNVTIARVQRSNHIQAEGPNWIFIVGGALLSTLSIRIGCRLKQAYDGKRLDDSRDGLPGVGKCKARRSEACRLHAHLCSSEEESENNCCQWPPGHSENGSWLGMPTSKVVTERTSTDPKVEDGEPSLSLVIIPSRETNKENSCEKWIPSPEHMEFPQQKPFHHSNSSESPCISESGSDMLNKREVVYKLRQQLKRRDEMIMEMQARISDLESSLNSQMSHSLHLQSQLDSANRDLFESEREIQHLRKAIANHAVSEIASPKLLATAPNWLADANGHSNGYVNSNNGFNLLYCGAGKIGRDGDMVEMLKNEVLELKEVIEGKEFLLQNYKEQKVELSTKIKEMQLRLASQVPNIL